MPTKFAAWWLYHTGRAADPREWACGLALAAWEAGAAAAAAPPRVPKADVTCDGGSWSDATRADLAD